MRRQYFNHIKKTAGTSIYSLLQRGYNWKDEILYESSKWGDLWGICPKRLSMVKFIRGHYGINLLKMIHGQIDYFTFLRQPVERCISDINYAHHHHGHWPGKIIRSKNISAKEAVFSDRFSVITSNHQTLNLGLDVPTEKFLRTRPTFEVYTEYINMGASKEMYESACENLNRAYFVGITEYFNLSYLALCYLNELRPDLTAEKSRSVSKGWAYKTIDDEALDYLKRKNKNDLKLYDYGLGLFVQKINKIFDWNYSVEQFISLHKEKLSHLEAEALLKVEELYEDRLLKDAPSSAWDALMPINGNGWHDVHSIDDRPHRWSGPATKSDIDIVIRDGQTKLITFELLNVIDMRLLDDLVVSVNGTIINHNVGNSRNKTGECSLSIIIEPGHYRSRGFARVEFDVGHTLSPSDIDPHSNDTMKRGIALLSYKVKSRKNCGFTR